MGISDSKSKADLLYDEVEAYQQAIEDIMSQGDMTMADVVTALSFQKDNLEEQVISCYKTRENYMYMAETVKGQIEALKARMDALKARADNFEKKAKTIDEVIKTAMITMNEDRIFSAGVTIEVKTSSPKVEIDDPESVPDELRNPVKRPEPSKTLLKPYLESHPDCEFAHLEKTIDVKYKVD